MVKPTSKKLIHIQLTSHNPDSAWSMKGYMKRFMCGLNNRVKMREERQCEKEIEILKTNGQRQTESRECICSIIGGSQTSRHARRLIQYIHTILNTIRTHWLAIIMHWQLCMSFFCTRDSTPTIPISPSHPPIPSISMPNKGEQISE